VRVAVYSGDDASPVWAFVDGNGTNGINKDASQGGSQPQLTVFGGRLYATWAEYNGTADQVRVAVYSGDDASPSWTFVDGGGANGINKDASQPTEGPQLTAFGGRLYATWQEWNGTAAQVRVAVYSGDDASPSWTFVDGGGGDGINKDAGQNAREPQLTVFGGRLYATWQEWNGTALQVRVAVYSGDDASPSWTFVDGGGTDGLNKDPARNAGGAQLTAFGDGLYAAWSEETGAGTVQNCVAVGR
jgi:hypothetical protein